MVTPQNIACFGPTSSEFPQICDDASMAEESRPLEPPTINLLAEASHCNERILLLSSSSVPSVPQFIAHLVIGALCVANVQSEEGDHSRI